MPPAYLTYLKEVSKGLALPPEEHFGTASFRELWDEADREALNITMGNEEHNLRLYERIEEVRARFDRMILIGGPPCQAYSLVGRARQKNVKGFRTRGDHRHFLYQQYLGILARFAPDVFIMENVKGILTSKVGKQHMFAAIQEDLADPARALGSAPARHGDAGRYILLPIHVEEGRLRTAESVARDPSGYIIRSERHGIPQARHRVIIMGVRADVFRPEVERIPGLSLPGSTVAIESALVGLPRLRSGLSRGPDDGDKWQRAFERERNRLARMLGPALRDVKERVRGLAPDPGLTRSSNRYADAATCPPHSSKHPRQTVLLNHHTRGHMESDLGRYMFCAAFGEIHQRSPTSGEFPAALAPDHANWNSGAFADRFRVQHQGRPSSTVTSHLSKDGHAFIHWDPIQCRSLTVREAARLQTFPDDYLFLGNRTQQFVQVGNAVPPGLARQIARVVNDVLECS